MTRARDFADKTIIRGQWILQKFESFMNEQCCTMDDH